MPARTEASTSVEAGTARGFTLIELMIVVAIIGIVVSLAVAAYQTYTVRAQVSEAIDFAAGAKSAVVAAWESTGAPPGSRLEAGLAPEAAGSRGSYVSQIDIVNGRVDITFGNDAHPDLATRRLSLTPYVRGDQIAWRCGNAPAPGGEPMSDTSGLLRAEHEAPTVENRYLPSACR